MLLGALPGLRYETEEARIGVGDLLFLYTDGMSELRREDEMLQVEGLREWLAACPESEPGEVVHALYERARAWSGERLHDDIALLALRCRLLAGASSAPTPNQEAGRAELGRSAA
jgi:serine phosphatase RsbU (regulator of sigma subunit)